MKPNKIEKNRVEAYVLGVLCQEMRLEAHGTFHFYVVGDFWSRDIAADQAIFKWCLMDLAIPMNDFDDKDEESANARSDAEEYERKLEIIRERI